MKVLMINGSPHEKGCTYTALGEIASALHTYGAEYEIVHIGSSVVHGCKACKACASSGKCAYDDDIVNAIIEKAQEADGFVFGSPVHYAAPAGALCAVLDRCFFAGARCFRGKPAAAVVSCRRAGATAALDRLNKYFTINHMPVVSAGYWNMVHGSSPQQVKRDLEGMQVMRALGTNTAWLIKCIKTGEENGLARPEPEDKIWTDFMG